MIALIQRVTGANVKVGGDPVGVIGRLTGDPAQDRLQLQRLKKRKLMLKDQIQRLRARLIPDIIA